MKTGMYEIEAFLKEDLWDLLTRLFPIYRSLTGPGFKQSLDLISEILPLQTMEFPTGSQCGSWTIPQEWDVREAYIETLDGKRIVDFSKNSFYILHYSRPFSGIISSDKLLEHIQVDSALPDAIPVRQTFYRDAWGFCLSQEERETLTDDFYRVAINTVFYDGALRIGEFYLPGIRHEEILLDAVLSVPATANNISGIAVAVMLMKLLAARENRHWSYRLFLTPETLGPIALHYLARDLVRNVIGGFTYTNLADRAPRFHYKKSRSGDTVTDKAMAHSLKHFDIPFEIQDYHVLPGSCGDEKAFNSLGIEVPIGAICRSPMGSYPEYFTSKDNLSFIDPDELFVSFKLCWGAIQALERTRFFKHQFEGEPFLTRYGLLPKIIHKKDRMPYDYLMAFSTGQLSLLEIADKAGLPVTEFDEAVQLMIKCGLVAETSAE
jgi:aminopeptidase-like protein